MKTAIVYYTQSGTNATLAEILAEKESATMIKLAIENEKKPCMARDAFAAIRGKCAILKNDINSDIAEFDKINLITPKWAGKPATAINTFLRDADLTNKEVALYVTQLDKRLESAEKMLNGMADKVTAQGGKVICKKALLGGNSKKPISKEDLIAQL